MTTAFKVKPTHKAVKSYYAALGAYANQRVEHEGAQALDVACGRGSLCTAPNRTTWTRAADTTIFVQSRNSRIKWQ